MKFFVPMSIIQAMFDVSNEIQKHESFSVVLCQAFSPLIEEVFILRQALSTSTEVTGIQIAFNAIWERSGNCPTILAPKECSSNALGKASG